MPARSPRGQPDASETGWFASTDGAALLESEAQTIAQALDAGPALPWLWLAPHATPDKQSARGLHLSPAADGRWTGGLRCDLPLPLASEGLCAIVLQHVLQRDAGGQALLEECARLLMPGGTLLLFALNPLAPYRWRWRGQGLQAVEPLVWRRRLRDAGLTPDAVSCGIGPQWRAHAAPRLHSGAGLRAAYLLRAEKRRFPLTPVRARKPLVLAPGIPAA